MGMTPILLSSFPLYTPQYRTEVRPVPMVASLWDPHTSYLVVLFVQLLLPGLPSFRLIVALWQPTHLAGLRVRSHPSTLAPAFPPTENSVRELPIYNVSLLQASQRQGFKAK